MIGVITPGHGGKDLGAVRNGLIEKDLTMFVAVRVEDRLDNYQGDFKVFQLPNVNAKEDLTSIGAYIKEIKADFLIDIHINSHTDPSAKGVEAFIPVGSTANGKNMFIYKRIYDSLATYCKSTGMSVRGLKERNDLYVLKLGIPAILVEIAFLSNPSDAQRLADHRWLDKCANAIAWGMVQAFNLKAR